VDHQWNDSEGKT